MKNIVINENRTVEDLINFLKENKEKIERKSIGKDYISFNISEKDNTAPYFQSINITLEKERLYNPNYGDERICICGHSYEKHFDSWEDYVNCGCKYCECQNFIEK